MGGRWYEVTEDGGTCEWGRVLAWDPPRRVVLAWQLNADFRYDPDFVTEVEVRFTALAMRETRVDFEHRNLDRFGSADAAKRLLGSMDQGWGQILGAFVQSAEG